MTNKTRFSLTRQLDEEKRNESRSEQSLIVYQPLKNKSILLHMSMHPIGILIMEDEKGVDEKILAVNENDPVFREFKDRG